MIRPARLLVLSLALVAACGSRPETLRIATTTSVDDSGLIDELRPAFEASSGLTLQVIAVGSGQAFQLGRRGDVAALMTHEPSGERALLDGGLVRFYRKVMFNHFVIAGPADDPAGVERAASAQEAMTRIAAGNAPFVSRGDESGTHVRERQLWQLAGVTPAPAALIETGQGMAPTLRVANQRHGYILTDEATLARLSGVVTLRPLFTGDPALVNTYAVLILNTAPRESEAAARTFADWMTTGDGQDTIARFRINGRQVFFPWPPGADAGSPEAHPAPRVP